ncbi:cardiolipin synthase [Aerococcus mictus]
MTNWVNILIIAIILINTVSAIYTVFRQERPVATIWAWLLVLILLPGLGFVIYFFLGRKISDKQIFQLNEKEAMGMTTLFNKNIDDSGKQRFISDYDPELQELIILLYRSNFSILTANNEVEIFDEGKEKIEALLKDIAAAKHHIHIQYYILTPDEVGNRVLDALTKKAQEGVEVRLLYDALGSRQLKDKDLEALRAAGGVASAFFGYSTWIQNFRLNFRNHRKIVVIDGRVGYIGGFNIAKEYIGKGPLGYWRDTHLRVVGEAVQALQSRFVVDWYASTDEDTSLLLAEPELAHDYFPLFPVEDKVPMQIVSSGPEDETDQIKMGYLKMITMARSRIYLHTPYFIPDSPILEALELAALSGIEVHIMIPCKPDHPFVYRATEYYSKEVLASGVHVHRYDKGFLHSKMMIVDDRIASVGTANFDIRSFRLNFEVNAFIYDKTVVAELIAQYERDLEDSTLLTREYFDNQSGWKKFKQKGSRLLAPIL